MYKLTPNLSLYGNYSRSFTPSTAIDDNGNVATPETGTTYEVGGKWQIAPAFDATLALYRIDESNMSIFINGVTRSIPKARSTGVELELNGEVARNWDLTANYSYDKTGSSKTTSTRPTSATGWSTPRPTWAACTSATA